MKVQNKRWIFPLALIWVAILIFPPTGNASSYGRVTDTEWKPIWEMKEAFNFPLLVIEMVVSGVLVYGTWVLLATRTPKTKSPKKPRAKIGKARGNKPSTAPSEPDEDTSELLQQYQHTIDYNWSVVKFWTIYEEEQLIGALQRRFGKSWQTYYKRLRTPSQGQMYTGGPIDRPQGAVDLGPRPVPSIAPEKPSTPNYGCLIWLVCTLIAAALKAASSGAQK